MVEVASTAGKAALRANDPETNGSTTHNFLNGLISTATFAFPTTNSPHQFGMKVRFLVCHMWALLVPSF